MDNEANIVAEKKEIIQNCISLSLQGAHRDVVEGLITFQAPRFEGVKCIDLVPEDVLVSWAQKAFKDKDYKSGAKMLLQFSYWPTKLITTEDFFNLAFCCIRNRKGDHGLHRLFSIIVGRLSDEYKEELPERYTNLLARVLHDVTVLWQDEFDRDFIIRGIREVFPAHAEKILKAANELK